MEKDTYEKRCRSLLTQDIVLLLTEIYECRGRQSFLEKEGADVLVYLEADARVRSIDASCRLSGAAVSRGRLKKLAQNKTIPVTEGEKEAAGYRDALEMIRNDYRYLQMGLPLLTEFQKKLAPRQGKGPRDSRRMSDIEEDCRIYEDLLNAGGTEPLLLTSVFLFDFLAARPFRRGNRRLFCLLARLLLYRSGHHVISYTCLEEGLLGLAESPGSLQGAVTGFLCALRETYREFSLRTAPLCSGVSKKERVCEAVRNHPGSITKSELMEACPDISQITIQRALRELQEQNEILKISGGRYTSYKWNEER